MTNQIPPYSGTAGFLHAALFYVRNMPVIRKGLEKRNLDFKLALDEPGFRNAALMVFKDGDFRIVPLSDEDVDDSTKWDAKMSAPGRILFDFFLGEYPIIPTLVLGKVKVTPYFMGLLRLLKLLWFVKILRKIYNRNKSLSNAVYSKLKDFASME